MIKKKPFSLPNHTFSKMIITYCVIFMSIVIHRIINIAEFTGISHTDIITASIVFFGGELLLLALKFTFDNKANTEIKKTKLELGKGEDEEC